MIAPTYIYRASLVAVVDGDTYRMRLDLGFGCAIAVSIRLHGWSCHEKDTPEGAAATVEAARRLQAAQAILVQTYRDARSFERWIADVYVDGEALGPLLGAAGVAFQGSRRGLPTRPVFAPCAVCSGMGVTGFVMHPGYVEPCSTCGGTGTSGLSERN